MTYISVNFIYFLIIFLFVYSIVQKQSLKRLILLAGNIFFYYFAGMSALFVVICSAVLVYWGARGIDKIYAGYREEANALTPPEKLKLFNQYKSRTVYIVIGILVMLLGIFAYVKTGKYLGWQDVGFAEFSFGKSMIVPLGLSYYTLSLVGYLVDVYRDRIHCEKSLFSFVTCVTYFPHIIQGPISRYDKLLEQIRILPAFNYERMCYGLQLMLWGYLKKLVLADTIFLYTTQVFSNLSGYSIRSMAVAAILYALQLYADFSGCIDIVTGISEIMGIRMDKNFNQPFFSTSAGEFWRRWHISLGVWFKDYIYMPIATASWFKNVIKKIRKKYGRQWGVIISVAVPSLAVWILTGIWHGTGMDYVIWGLYWGTIIILAEILNDKFVALKNRFHIRDEVLPYRVFMMVRTFLLYCMGLLIIMPGTIPHIAGNIERTTGDNAIIVLGVVSFMVVECLLEGFHKRGLSLREYIGKQNIWIRWTIYLSALLLLVLLGRFGIGYDADTFIYAGF